MASSISLTPIGASSIFSERTGTCFTYHNKVKIVIVIDPKEIVTHSSEINELLTKLRKYCDNTCEFHTDIETLAQKNERLSKAIRQLTYSMHTKNRRGLLNFIGSISKTLFGTLDDSDLTLINQNIDKLFDSQNTLTRIITNQTNMIRNILDSTQMETLDKLKFELKKNAYTTNRQVHITSELIIIESIISETLEQIHELNNAIMLGKQGIINPQFIKPEQFLLELSKVITENFFISHIEPKIENYQLLLDISTLTLATINNKIIYQISVPLLEDEEWEINRIYPIPHKQQSIFVAPVIEHNIILESAEQYVAIDSEYLRDKCKLITSFTVCERTQPSHSKTGTRDCQFRILDQGIELDTCPTAVFRIHDITFIPLHAKNQFIVIPKEPIDVKALCKQSTTITIDRPAILASKEECILRYNDNIMKMGGQGKTVQYDYRFKNFSIDYSNEDLKLLEKQISLVPKMIPNFNDYKISLDQMDLQLDQQKNQRRLKSWQEIGFSTLHILGYIALALGLLYTLNKCGISKLVPKKFCIKICCPKAITKQTSNLKTSDIRPDPPVPQSSRGIEIENTREEEEATPIIIKPKLKQVRFERPKRI